MKYIFTGGDPHLRDWSGRKARQYLTSKDTSVSADTFRSRSKKSSYFQKTSRPVTHLMRGLRESLRVVRKSRNSVENASSPPLPSPVSSPPLSRSQSLSINRSAVVWKPVTPVLPFRSQAINLKTPHATKTTETID